MSNGGEPAPICPCGVIVHPSVVFNPPGRSVIAYRSGDYATFRHALLQPRDHESELTERSDGRLLQIWRPTTGDLALQMIEWWAYLADILTYYNERVAGEGYLRTAELPQSLNRLIRILGYRPRPAIGATGTLAALVNSPKPVTLPQSFPIQSKPGPGKQPQVFELSVATRIGPPDATAAVPPRLAAPLVTPGTGGASATGTVLIAGIVSGLKAGDEVLLLQKGWDGTNRDYAIGTVQKFTPQPDPSGAKNTQVIFAIRASGDGVSGATAVGYRLLKIGGTATLYPYLDPASSAIGDGFVHLASVFRQIAVGDPIVIDDPRAQGGNWPFPASVTGYQELVYYANNPTQPDKPPVESPPSDRTPAIPIPHTRLTFTSPAKPVPNATTYVVRFGWRDVGTLIDVPATTVGGAGATSGAVLRAPDEQSFPVPIGTAVLVEDANGDGTPATIESATTIDLPSTAPALTAPLQALFNLLPVSRGKTVLSELLGSGNAAILGQDFTLRNAPVTYLQDAASMSGDDYSSTVKVWVNGVQWREVRSFYGLPEGAQAFMTREDEQGKTHVVFASRLPTGVNNVAASYRYGAGAETPAPGTLTVILQPQPGLRSIRNPVAPGGGADADPPDKIRRLAPRSVLTFNRAVSLDDYEVIAGSAPGVRRAKAAFSFDAVAQRPSVTIWVGDDSGAVTAARSALAGAADPNRPVAIALAHQQQAVLSLTYLRDPRYEDARVKTALHDALLDADNGLFGVNVVDIGQAFYDSQIFAACLAVPGVEAVQSLSFSTVSESGTVSHAAPTQTLQRATSSLSRRLAGGDLSSKPTGIFGFRPLPASGTAVRGAPASACRDHRYDPGLGGYFFIPDDSAHLILTGAVAT
jgi:hypothetical protein